MARPKLVKLLSTGGTIATRTDAATGRSAPRDSGREVLASALSAIAAAPSRRGSVLPAPHISAADAGSAATLGSAPGAGSAARAGQPRRPHVPVPEVVELFRVPSWALDPRQMETIALAARDTARDPSTLGVVVTHGTTTLEYSAFLADLYLDVDTPVVFTGAMRRADHPAPDGPANLRDALLVAAAPASRGRGALVVFDGRILSAREAWKRERTDPDAFIGLEGGVGTIRAGRVRFTRGPVRPAALHGPLDPNVAIIKAYPGMDDAAIRSVIDRGVHGLVLEGLPGTGGLPAGTHEVLAEARRRGVEIVVSSRSPSGAIPNPPAGGTGEPVGDLGMLSAGTLTTEKAWILLMVLLGHERGERLRECFDLVAQPPAQPS